MVLFLYRMSPFFFKFSFIHLSSFSSPFSQASMDLPPDKAKLLKNYDNEKKWDIICDQVSFGSFMIFLRHTNDIPICFIIGVTMGKSDSEMNVT